MTRRFRLSPVNIGGGGFRQTLILPPASVPQVVEVQAPPVSACDGVAEPPAVLDVIAYPFSCGPAETPYQYVVQNAGSLPEGYELRGPVGGPADPPDAACLESEPTGWLLYRVCDDSILTIPVSITIDGGA